MKHILLVILAAFATNVWAQQEPVITGKVVDSNGVPLIGATVYGTNVNDAVITNENGEFSLKKGSSFYVASYVGYQNDTILSKDLKNNLVFKLQAGVIIDKVTVEHRQNSTFSSSLDPMKTSVITETELHKGACCNLSESFETNPSIDVSFTDAVTGTKQIQMLGLAGPYIQISRENMPDVRGLAAIYGLGFVPGTWVRTINLNKGAGSVVNGFESITGQIDVQLQNPSHMDRLYLNLFTNSSQRFEANLNLSQKINHNWSTALLLHANTLNAKHDSNDDGFLDIPTGHTFIGLNRWEMHNDKGIHLQIGIKGAYINKLGGQTDFKRNRTIDTLHPWGMTNEIARGDAWFKIGKVNSAKPWQSFGFQASGAYHDQFSRFGLRAYDATQTSGYANFIFQSIINNTNHEIKTGASIQYDDYKEEFDLKSYDRMEIVPGAFGEYSFVGSKKFNVVAGLRADYHSEFGAFITPRLHLRYAPIETLILRASGGRGLRTANIFSENNHLFASSRAVEIKSNNDFGYGLDPEIAWNFGLNVTKNFKLWYRKGSISLDAYRTQFQNQIIVDFIQDSEKIVFYNLNGKSFSNSLQWQLDYELIKRLDVRIAYRWYDVKTTYDGSLMSKPFLSSHRAFINLAYSTQSDWTFDCTLQWQGSKPIPTVENSEITDWDEESPSFFILNAQVSKGFWNKQFEVYVGAENILGFVQENPIISASEPYGDSFDAAMIWGPIHGREIYLGLRCKIK